MDTFMKEANAQPVSFGEYKVTKTIKGLKTTSVPESTQDFNQFQATTNNEINLDTQFQTTAKEATSADNFNFFQGDSNLDTEEFATVKVIQSNETSSDVNLNQFQTEGTTTTNTTETKLEGFDTNAQFDFGNSNTNFETNTTNIVDTNTFNAESATKDLGNFDFNTNTQTQFGEFQTETNLTLGEAFGKTETSTTTNLKPCFEEASSNKGDNFLHGPHHVAKKSTTTGFFLLASITSLSKELFGEKCKTFLDIIYLNKKKLHLYIFFKFLKKEKFFLCFKLF